ncbi:hypothetical protein [Actinoplanes sp. URMC 104]|uniref:hypothetical protein n=1 Tax=Actinoplanes sp. URMC 104 TaxID=3423409 RepID=UPI003F1B5722
MRTRRLALAGAAIAVIALAGCGDKDAGAGSGSGSAAGGASAPVATTTAPATPAAELEEAAGKLGDTPVKVTLSSAVGMTVSGSFDAKAQKGDVSMDLGPAGGMSMRQVGTDLYVKVTGSMASSLDGSAAKKWMHVDLSKVPEKSSLNIKNNDPRQTAKLLTSASAVKKTGEHSFTGTADMTKSPTFDAGTAGALAGKMSAVPFTAETDAQGRLVELVFDLEKVAPGGGQMTTKYSNFGVPVKAEAPPAAQVVEMPAAFAKAMGA